MNNSKISAVVLSHDNGKTINDCLVSLLWCDEIIVVDDDSKDLSIENIKNDRILGKSKIIKVFKRKLESDFSGQRNFGLGKASSDWVLFVDGDERIPESLAGEIQRTLMDPGEVKGFFLRRKDFFEGKWLKYGETAGVRLLRLGIKGSGVWKGKVHEVWDISGKTALMENPIEHFPHPTISDFLSQINTYTDQLMRQWKNEGRTVRAWEIFVYPAAKFLHNYLFRLGFLDGSHGFVLACMMSFHSFLARSKYWLEYVRDSNE